MEAIQKVVDRIEKGVNFCNDCIKEGCRFRGIVWDCDDKMVSCVQGDEKKQ